MGITKNARLKQRSPSKAFEYASKLALLAATVLFCLWIISGAHAASQRITGIRADAAEGGASRITFSFSEEVGAKDASVDFQRNFVQLSFNGASAYPAKNKSVGDGTVDKVIIYQYEPELARARIMLNGDAEKFKNTTRWEVKGKEVSVVLSKESDSVKQRAAATGKEGSQADEDRAVKQILNETKAPAASEQKLELKKEEEPIAPKEEPSPMRKVFSGLFTVLVLIAAAALAFRRFALGKGMKFAGGRDTRMIDVVASHGLGPKKSISVVRVGDQYIAVGIAGENIQMLMTLDAKANIEKYLDRDEIGSFSHALDGKLRSDDSPAPNAMSTIRSSIKKRIEGFKPL